MNLYHIKLSNGDELITQIQETKKRTKFELVNPMILSNIYDKDSNQAAIVLYSYSPFSLANPVEIENKQIVTKVKVEGNMKNYYQACLEYSHLYSNRDMETKIGLATKSMNDFLKQRLSESLGISPSYDELDDSIMEELTSANTTFH